MTSLTHIAAPSRLTSAVSGLAWAAIATLRRAGSIWLRAPAIIAVAVLPEFAQHMAEIHLGMFDSKAAFRASGNDPLRWIFAYPKVAGFVLAILLSARFLALGSVRNALRVRPANLARIAFAIALSLAAELPFRWLEAMTTAPVAIAILKAASMLIQAGLLVYLVGTLVDDRHNKLSEAMFARLPTTLLLITLAGAIFVPAQALHLRNHVAAFGQPQFLVWALMIFDSLWVGVLASGVGAALYTAYSAGPTWHGWSEKPGPRLNGRDETAEAPGSRSEPNPGSSAIRRSA